MDRHVLSSQEYYQGCMAVLLLQLLSCNQDNHTPDNSLNSIVTLLRDGLSLASQQQQEEEEPHFFLGLILDTTTSGTTPPHPGLALTEWDHVLGLVSTLQSSIAVVERRRVQRKWRLLLPQNKQQQQLSLLGTNNNKIACDSLEAMWAIPLAYMVGYVVYHQQQKQDQQLRIDWKTQVRPKIDAILQTAFPKLRPNEFVDAGLLLLRLDLLLQQSTKNKSWPFMPSDVTSIAQELLEEYVSDFWWWWCVYACARMILLLMACYSMVLCTFVSNSSSQLTSSINS